MLLPSKKCFSNKRLPPERKIIMSKPIAVFMTDTPAVTFHQVYPDVRMEQLRALCEISDTVVTSEKFGPTLDT